MTIDPTSKVLAIVPARGGSKGIPRKNLMLVAGKPLIAWTIEAVADATHPMRCVVSTDDEDIAEVSQRYGAEVVWRPAELATDDAPTEPTLIHALDELGGHDYQPLEVILLQATSPMRRPGTLDAALRQFRESEATSLVGVVEEHPFLWTGPVADPTALYDVGARPRRQDLTADQRRYRETGSIYITTPGALQSSGNRISGHTVLFTMTSDEGGDIDTLTDMGAAEATLRGDRDASRP